MSGLLNPRGDFKDAHRTTASQKQNHFRKFPSIPSQHSQSSQYSQKEAPSVNPSTTKATIYYHDIDDHLPHEQKFVSIREFGTIVNALNLWCGEHNQPRYLIDLLKRFVMLSIETLKIMKSLPKIKFRAG